MVLVRKSRDKVSIVVIFFLDCIDFFAYILNPSKPKQMKAFGRFGKKTFLILDLYFLKLPTIFRPFPYTLLFSFYFSTKSCLHTDVPKSLLQKNPC